MKRLVLSLSAVAMVSSAALMWLRARPGGAAVAAETPQDPVVSAVRAARQDLVRSLTVTAELTPFQEVEVMAKVPGYVQQINVDVGDVVRRGQVLAVLEVPEMQDDLTRAAAAIQRNRAEVARFQDEVRRADSAYAMAHLTYGRLAGVAKTQPGLVAQQEIDDAQSRELMAAAQLAGAKSALLAAEEQLKVSEAEQNKFSTLMNYSRVVAPFDGVVTRRYANTGSMIQAGTASQSQAMPVVRLSENQFLRLVLPVPESAAGSVKAGNPVEVRLPSLGRSFPGKVARVADKVDTATRTMETEVDIPNGDRSLIPGMYAEVTLQLEDRKQAVAVPLQALDRTQAGATVHVINEDGRVEVRTVSTGIETPTMIEIRSGLQAGEMVAVGNHGRLVPHQRVTPKVAGSPGKSDS
jgi:RND family efflux transporter MFP subunit